MGICSWGFGSREGTLKQMTSDDDRPVHRVGRQPDRDPILVRPPLELDRSIYRAEMLMQLAHDAFPNFLLWNGSRSLHPTPMALLLLGE